MDKLTELDELVTEMKSFRWSPRQQRQFDAFWKSAGYTSCGDAIRAACEYFVMAGNRADPDRAVSTDVEK